MQEEFSCSSINNEIKKYGDYKRKIDNLFTQLSKKDETIKNKYFTKIDNLTKKYLDKLDEVKQKKLYTVIGYLKCENRELLRPNLYKKEYGLDKVLKNIEQNVNKFKFTSTESVGDIINIVGPTYVAKGELERITILDLEKLIGYKFKGIKKYNFGNDSFGLLSVSKKGDYLFLEMQANLGGGSYGFYFVLDSELNLKKYRGVEFIGDKAYLWDRKNNIDTKTEILNLNSESFVTKDIDGLEWAVEGYTKSQS
ncbi:MAG: hypothetical protein Q9M97_05855 [Candidatus Gracilibacteria bacterium]|nr:hypothetical protein [Candidatus Gracilibacteria bacterium]